MELADGTTGCTFLFSTADLSRSRFKPVASMEKCLPVFRRHVLSTLYDALCSHMVFGNYYTNVKPPAGELPYIIIPGIIFLVVIAYLVMVFYDMPVRKYCQKKAARAKHQP
jgi:hypothetical protein